MNDQLKRGLPLLLAALMVLALGAWVSQDANVLHAQGEEEPEILTPIPLKADIGNPYLIADVAERVTPAVVYIEVTWPAQERARHPFANDPFFREFFPFFPWPDTRQQVQRGTGFIIDEAGYILTNQHVVGNPDGGQTIKVKINTADFHGDVEATLLGADERLDLAVLKIDKPKELDVLPTIPLGDSDASRPGEWVIAIGNPYGEQFEHTVTVGVLSAKGREIQIRDGGTPRTYRNLMQTDAAINPGNSGGPLINIKGEVIGINTAVSATAQGIGFAIPINTAIAVKEQLITDGRVQRAFLGVSYENLTQTVADILGLPNTNGVLVRGVVEDSGAEKAGIQVHDVIVRVGRMEVKNDRDLVAALEGYKPGDQVAIHVIRQGEEKVLTATLGVAPDALE